MRFLLVTDDGVEADVSAADYVHRYNELMAKQEKPKIIEHKVVNPTEGEIGQMVEDFQSLRFEKRFDGWYVTSFNHEGDQVTRKIHMIEAKLSEVN